MKLENTKQIDFKSNTTFDGVDASISQENIHKLWDMLQNPYKDAISSIVRECVSNSFDAHAEAKFIKENSIEDIRKEFSVYHNHTNSEIASLKQYLDVFNNDAVTTGFGSDTNGTYWFTEDVGVGLSEDRVKNVFVSYLTSTKDNTNTSIGAFGIGAKSPLSYTDVFFIRSRYCGLESNYMLRKGEQGPRLEFIGVEETSERNGTQIKIYLKTNSDKSKFEEAMAEQLRYFENVYFSNCLISNDYKLYRANTFILNSIQKPTYKHQLHVCNGQVSYPIDFSILDMRSIEVDVALKFEVGELEVIQTREDLRYTPKTINALKIRIKEFQKELLERLEEQSPKYINEYKNLFNINISSYRRVISITPEISVFVKDLGLSYEEAQEIFKFGYTGFQVEENPTDPIVLPLSSNLRIFSAKITSKFNNNFRALPYKASIHKDIVEKKEKASLFIRATENLVPKKNRYVLQQNPGYSRYYIIRKETDFESSIASFYFDGKSGIKAPDYFKDLVKHIIKEEAKIIKEHSIFYDSYTVPKEFEKVNKEERKIKKDTEKFKISVHSPSPSSIYCVTGKELDEQVNLSYFKNRKNILFLGITSDLLPFSCLILALYEKYLEQTRNTKNKKRYYRKQIKIVVMAPTILAKKTNLLPNFQSFESFYKKVPFFQYWTMYSIYPIFSSYNVLSKIDTQLINWESNYLQANKMHYNIMKVNADFIGQDFPRHAQKTLEITKNAYPEYFTNNKAKEHFDFLEYFAKHVTKDYNLQYDDNLHLKYTIFKRDIKKALLEGNRDFFTVNSLYLINRKIELLEEEFIQSNKSFEESLSERIEIKKQNLI